MYQVQCRKDIDNFFAKEERKGRSIETLAKQVNGKNKNTTNGSGSRRSQKGKK
jgi:hypothetical protein